MMKKLKSNDQADQDPDSNENAPNFIERLKYYEKKKSKTLKKTK
jgi:hypothetical protein